MQKETCRLEDEVLQLEEYKLVAEELEEVCTSHANSNTDIQTYIKIDRRTSEYKLELEEVVHINTDRQTYIRLDRQTSEYKLVAEESWKG